MRSYSCKSPRYSVIMDARNFVQGYFGENWTLYSRLASGTHRIAQRSSRIFQGFMDTHFRDQSISMDHLIAYMLYRVVGKNDDNDEHAGACQLDTFMHAELGPLIHSLTHESRIDFSFAELQNYELYARSVSRVRTELSERPAHTHSRPLYPSDELRLRSSLTFDTSSKRDHALLVLLLRTGCRPATAALIRRSVHIMDRETHLTISLPGVKTNDSLVEAVFTADDADVIRSWIRCRNVVFPEFDYLFVSSSGTKLTCDMVTRMMSQLSLSAGYGEGFFTAQSCRVGYANTIAAEVYARGGTRADALASLYSGSQWAENSKAVSHYLDPNLRNFFARGLNLSFNEFASLSPEEVHRLERLQEPRRRPLTWFQHSDERLFAILRNLGLEPPRGRVHDQKTLRIHIGYVLLRRCDEFSSFIADCASSSRKSFESLLSDAVGCLLERDSIDLLAWLSEKEEWGAALVIDSYPRPFVPPTTTPQRVQVHNLMHRDQADVLVKCLKKRKYDRKLHLGKLSQSGNLVVLKVRKNERHCHQARTLRGFDIDLEFPEVSVEELSDDDVPPPTPPANQVSSTPSTAPTTRPATSSQNCM
jgi:hypothetical protein